MGLQSATRQTAAPQRADPERSASRSGSRRAGSAAPPIHRLQRAVGNRAINHLLRSHTIQPKLTVGEPHDKYEREADCVADQVMRMREPNADVVQRAPVEIQRMCTECEGELQRHPIVVRQTPTVAQRKCSACEKAAQDKHDWSTVQRFAVDSEANDGEASSELESFVAASHGVGRPLSDSARAFFEPRFGQDFSHVRVHTGSRAAAASNDISARAFTTGSDIYFAPGQYRPGSDSGDRLLGHELTHVVQQQHESVATLQSQEPKSAALHSIQRDPQAGHTIRRDDKPKSAPPKSKNLYFAVGDNSLNLGGGVFVKDMETLKAELMKTSGEGGEWTLSMTMHGAEKFFGLSGGDVTGGLTENDAKAYNKTRVQQIFGDAKFQAWRKKHGPKRINLLSCQIGKDLEETFLQLLKHPTSSQHAVGLGQGCILINTPLEATMNGKHIRTREQYNKLGDTEKQQIDKKLKEWNDAYGYNGEKIKPGEILNQYFDEAPEGLWVQVEIITPSRKKVSYLNRTSEKAFIDECQPSRMKEHKPAVPVPADEL